MLATQCMLMERNTPSIFCPVESSIQNVLQSLVSALDFNYNFVTSFSQSVTFLSYCWTLQRLLIRVGSSNLMTNSVTIHCYTRVLWMWYHLRYLPWLPLVKQIVTLTIDNLFHFMIIMGLSLELDRACTIGMQKMFRSVCVIEWI